MSQPLLGLLCGFLDRFLSVVPHVGKYTSPVPVTGRRTDTTDTFVDFMYTKNTQGNNSASKTDVSMFNLLNVADQQTI